MLQLRRQLPQLTADAPRQLLQPEQPALLAFIRGTAEQPLMFIANFSDEHISVALPDLLAGSGMRDLTNMVWQNMLDKTITGQTVEVPACGQLWLIEKTTIQGTAA